YIVSQFTTYHQRLTHVSLLTFSYTDTTTTQSYTLSLHDALPLLATWKLATTTWPMNQMNSFRQYHRLMRPDRTTGGSGKRLTMTDRKSTRLNSSHVKISYAVFCLKKKK